MKKIVALKDYPLRDLESELTIVDPKINAPAWVPVISLSICFSEAMEIKTREGLIRVYSRFVELFGDQLRWRSNYKTENIVKYPAGGEPADFLLGDIHPFVGYRQISYGGSHKRGSSNCFMSFSGKGGKPGNGALCIGVPISFLLDKRDIFFEFVDYIFDSLNVVMGHGGLSGSVAPLQEAIWRGANYAIGQHYYGFVPNALDTGLMCKDGQINTVDWLLAINSSMKNSIDAQVFAELEKVPSVMIYQKGEISLIQAGELPDPGFHKPPESYVQVYRLLKKYYHQKSLGPPFYEENLDLWSKRLEVDVVDEGAKWPGKLWYKGEIIIEPGFEIEKFVT